VEFAELRVLAAELAAALRVQFNQPAAVAEAGKQRGDEMKHFHGAIRRDTRRAERCTKYRMPYIL
jgi:hypothetical protein